ncbi:hypothetical protein HCN44_009557 [Aphidius gifuensis]|uniref:FHA domain-containing protein n=1 Tax=Aphidius gifuensis TaxID=684658 RepID=A0A835CVJ6_APHGI|nr:hypothetical protein HCN44_009557 [Aphidius gifuensis]
MSVRKVGIFCICGKKIPIYSNLVYVGTHSTCEIKLENDSLSKFHASFQWTNSGIVITDLNSQTKTQVNNVVLKPLEPVLIITTPAIITIGKLKGLLIIDEIPLKDMAKAVRDTLRLTTGLFTTSTCVKCNDKFLRKKMNLEELCNFKKRDMSLYCCVCKKKINKIHLMSNLNQTRHCT